MSEPDNPVAVDDVDLPDDDPNVVAGMKRLAELREVEHEVIDLNPPTR